MILAAIFAIAAAYQVFAAAVCLIAWRVAWRAACRPAGRPPAAGPVSILKPVRGLDPSLREAIASHTRLTGDFELLCGVRSLDDPAVPLLREFPQVRIIPCSTVAPNGKAGVLADLVRAARYPLIVVNDADIRVQPDYLTQVTGPLQDPRVGLVTCLFRVAGDTFAARFEGLAVVTEFAPSALVARMLGLDEFAMGSTLAFRKADLDRIGGFEAFADYLADDYQLGARIHGLGLRCVLSDVIVTTHMGGDWGDVWRHQVRWLRTIRVSKFGGYLGLPVTFATLWAVVAAAFGQWHYALALLAVRMIAATAGGWLVVRSEDVLKLWPLIPLRDLFGVAVWATGLFGRTVLWRGQRLRLDPQGRILPPVVEQASACNRDFSP